MGAQPLPLRYPNGGARDRPGGEGGARRESGLAVPSTPCSGRLPPTDQPSILSPGRQRTGPGPCQSAEHTKPEPERSHAAPAPRRGPERQLPACHRPGAPASPHEALPFPSHHRQTEPKTLAVTRSQGMWDCFLEFLLVPIMHSAPSMARAGGPPKPAASSLARLRV